MFFVIFFAISIFLGIEIWRTPIQLSGSGTNPSKTLSISDEIKADNIDLPSHLSDDTKSGYYLAASDQNYFKNIKDLRNINSSYSTNDQTFYATLQKPVTLSKDSDEALSEVKAFKNNTHYVPFGSEYEYASVLSDNNNYVFVQNSKFGQVYDNSAQLTIKVKKNQIIGYEQTYLGKLSNVRELQSTISAWKAIQNLYIYRELTNNSKVLWIKLEYTRLTEVRKSIILLPTWVVEIQNKTSKTTAIKHINAFTGQVIQTSSYSNSNS
ncbi:hypothetical protein FC23_GL000430 [Lactobacillus psittaci DSM 15354]|uniref:Regulatory protein YycH-like domain-containing protein n=1 Tax=Lactobacillus psittaci DSM 15354 TaxID=1122152 RepID=A0A0R1RY80_9LACO|nr:hypothetical protein FC23_GL000430 [Lactobacillus psittaci DSM 15354]